jgi:hypothetical protein
MISIRSRAPSLQNYGAERRFRATAFRPLGRRRARANQPSAASEIQQAPVPADGANEQPLLELPDEGEVVALEPELATLEPDGAAAPLAPDEVVPEPAVVEPVVTPEVVAPLVVPALATPVDEAPLPVPEEVAAPLVAPLVEPVEASSGSPPPSGPPPPTPESDGGSVPPSTGVVAMPVAPQKTR